MTEEDQSLLRWLLYPCSAEDEVVWRRVHEAGDKLIAKKFAKEIAAESKERATEAGEIPVIWSLWSVADERPESLPAILNVLRRIPRPGVQLIA